MVKKQYLSRIFFIIIVSALAFTVYYLAKEKISKPKPRIAIVIDDWGYNLNNLESLYQIKKPVTLAVLPNLKYSKHISIEARKKGYEVLLHLPLESKSNKNPESGVIRCNMFETEVVAKLDKAFKGISKVSGVNNHQGSNATENPKLMGIVLSYIKRQKLFFLDSVTTNKSVCAEICKDIGVKYAKRDIFLDLPERKLKGKNLENYIRGQLDKLAELALKRGYAIGIGHDRPTTLRVVGEMMPKLEKRGIKIMRVSDLVRVSIDK